MQDHCRSTLHPKDHFREPTLTWDQSSVSQATVSGMAVGLLVFMYMEMQMRIWTFQISCLSGAALVMIWGICRLGAGSPEQSRLGRCVLWSGSFGLWSRGGTTTCPRHSGAKISKPAMVSGTNLPRLFSAGTSLLLQ